MKKLNLGIYILFLLFTIFPLFSEINAQPVNRWVRFYDGSRDTDMFWDVFATDEGGYAMTGESRINGQQNGYWLVVTGADGDEIWQRTYIDERFPGRNNRSYSLIQADDGGFLLGGSVRDNNGHYNFSLLRVDAEGERLWWRTYGEAHSSECYAVIELKSGEFIAAGRAPNPEAYAVMVNGDGNVLWENNYPGATMRAIRETQGGLLFAGSQTENHVSSRWIIKTDFDGEIIWSRVYGEGTLHSLVSCQEGGFAAAGIDVGGEDVDWFLLRINDEGEQLWTRTYDFGVDDRAACLVRMADGGFALVGKIGPGQRGSSILRTDSAGNEQWRRTDNNNEGGGNVDRYDSAVLGRDNLLMVAGTAHRGDERRTDGVLIKIVPDRSPPTIWSYIPEELEFTELLDDSVFFAILEAEDAQNDSLLYYWTSNADNVGTDTSTTITFEELGDHFVECFVSDGDQADSVQ